MERWIKRTGAHEFEFTTVGAADNNSMIRTFMDSNNPMGDAIDFFSDLWAAEAGTPVVFDSFRVE